MYDPVYLHPANNRFLSMKHVFNNSDSGISMFFIWIFIIVNDVELFRVLISYLKLCVKCLSYLLSILWLIFLLLSFESPLNILDTNPLWYIWFKNSLPQSVACLFILLAQIQSFLKFYIDVVFQYLYKVQFINFFLLCIILLVSCENSSPIPKTWRFSSIFFQKFYTSCLAFKSIYI